MGNDNSSATVRLCVRIHTAHALFLYVSLPLTVLLHDVPGFKHDHYHHVRFVCVWGGGGPRFKYKQGRIHFVLTKVPWTQSPLVSKILINNPS